MPREGRVRPDLWCHTRRCCPSAEGPCVGARAWLRMKSPGWGMGRSAAGNIPAPAQELEAHEPIMASSGRQRVKDVLRNYKQRQPWRIYLALPQQRPACLRLAREQLSLCLPPPEPNGLSLSLLSLTHSGLCRLGPGDGQLVPGRPNRPAAHLVWARGPGREGVRGLRLLELKGPWNPHCRVKHRPERGWALPPGHTAQKS